MGTDRHYRCQQWQIYLISQIASTKYLFANMNTVTYLKSFRSTIIIATKLNHCSPIVDRAKPHHIHAISSAITHWGRNNIAAILQTIFSYAFFFETVRISLSISPKFVSENRINNIPALFQLMSWRRPGDKPLSGPMRVSLVTHICVTWPQWVKIKCYIGLSALPLGRGITRDAT